MFPKQYLSADNKGKRLPIWAPPRSGVPLEDEQLAAILNLMAPVTCLKQRGNITPQDARACLAIVNEKQFEPAAEKAGIHAIEVRAPILTVYAALKENKLLHPDCVELGVMTILQEFSRMQAEQFERDHLS